MGVGLGRRDVWSVCVRGAVRGDGVCCREWVEFVMGWRQWQDVVVAAGCDRDP